MNELIQTNEYYDLIKKIKTRKTLIIIFTIISTLITMIICSPIQMKFFGTYIIDYPGTSPAITVISLLIITIISAILLIVNFLPLGTALHVECNPHKYIIINSAFNKPKQMYEVYAIGFLYIGNFAASLDYANKMVANNKPKVKLNGLFNKARCEFFLGDFNSFKQTVKQFESQLSSIKNTNAKITDFYNKITNTLNLMVALSLNDKEKISFYRNIETWNGSNITNGYVYFLKGLAAYHLEEKDEVIYRFKYVKENCDKTVLSQFADKYLSEISNNN